MFRRECKLHEDIVGVGNDLTEQGASQSLMNRWRLVPRAKSRSVLERGGRSMSLAFVAGDSCWTEIKR